MNGTLIDIAKTGLGDYRLEAFAWSQSGEDIVLTLLAPGAGTHRLVLRLVWATDVRIEMDFGRYAGTPLVFGSAIERTGSPERYAVRIDFGGAPDGFIALVCNDVHLTECQTGSVA